MIIIWSLRKLCVWLQSVACLGHIRLKGIFLKNAMFVQLVDMGQKVAQSRGYVLYIGLYRENINTYFI